MKRLTPITVGIGTTRFPKDDREGAVDLFRFAIDSGMNYIDASRSYWDIELLLAKVLKDGYRDKVKVSSKWSPWMMKEGEPTEYYMRKNIEESLKRLEIDYLDYYQIWNLSSLENFDLAVKKDGMVDGLLKAKKNGLIRRIGYTTHDTPKNVLGYIRRASAWTNMITFSYNILNQEHEETLWEAYKLGLETVVMNPLGGGSFLRENSFLQHIVNETGTKSIADFALKFVASYKNVHMILSGISKKSDVTDTLNSINSKLFDLGQWMEIRERMRASKQLDNFCTSCGYCLPCPVRINIPAIMQCIFLETFNGDRKESIENYSKIEGPKAGACIECGQCENKCTQSLKIINGMRHARKYYE